MRRREFIGAAAGAVGASAGIGAAARGVMPHTGATPRRRGQRFKLAYAPHFGMFKSHAGNDLVDQLSFAADEGFWAWEDNTMTRRPAAVQERLGQAMRDLGMTMGVFVANFGTAFGKQSFVNGSREHLDNFLTDLRTSVEVARRVGATWMTVVLGDSNPGLEWDYQTANAIEMLRRGAEVFEPHGLVMVLEPLNPWTNHAGMFLSRIPQAYMICRAVNSPAVKVLDDLYHQQITEGNLIPNIDKAWSEIAYFQLGDNPGRNEPSTGEINYRGVFGHLHGRGYTGVLGMEHGNSRPGKKGERAVIDAYRWCDDFQ